MSPARGLWHGGDRRRQPTSVARARSSSEQESGAGSTGQPVRWQDIPGTATNLLPVVSPSGALPRRFGLSALSIWLLRFVGLTSLLLLALAVASVTVLRDVVPEDLRRLAGSIVLPLAIYAGSLLFRRGRGGPVGLLFEPSGVVVLRTWGSQRFGWGELVGLEPPDEGESVWHLVARRGAEEWRLGLDGRKTWIAELLAELLGEQAKLAPEESPIERDPGRLRPPAGAPVRPR
jgi:hypothetical protein